RHAARRDLVVPAVEMADEPHDLRLARICARQPQREVRCLGSRGREAHAIGRWDKPLHKRGPLHFELMRRAPMGAERNLPLHRFDDRRMAVAVEQRAVTTKVVDILVAVDVPFARSRRARDVDGVGRRDSGIVRQARRQDFTRLGVQHGRAGRAGAVFVFDRHACPKKVIGETMARRGGSPMLPRLLSAISAIAAGSLFSFCVSAQDLPKTHFKVIGLNGPTVASSVDEVPFWRTTLPKASNGAITADITPLDQLGLDDKTMLRLLRLGVMDFASMDISKMAG